MVALDRLGYQTTSHAKWGLTTSQISEQPWGLTEGELLASNGKVITDPVHGDIFLNPLELQVVNSFAFQRLRRVRQLGTTHLIYPGATHSRFSHSLAALRVAQDLLDAALQQRFGRHAVPDLFAQWEKQYDGHSYNWHVARMTVLARLGALLHDLCHVPFGHSIEDDLEVLKPHDENDARFNRLWAELGDEVVNALDRENLKQQLKPLIIAKGDDGDATSKKPPWERLEYPFVADIVGNTICADLLDYLRRDHLYAGLPFSLGTRFQTSFYVVPYNRPPYERRMVLNVTRNAHERVDVVSELLKALRYRYELSERALAHHAKLSADAMVGKALELWSHAQWIDEAAHRHDAALAGNGHAEGHAKPFVPSNDIDRMRDDYQHWYGEKAADELLVAVRARLEEVFCTRGDDGLLEYLLDLTRRHSEMKADDPARNCRLVAVHRLVRALLGRRLYALAGRVSRGGAPAETLYKRFGNADKRRCLEQDAERYAELDCERYTALHGSPKVVLWLPDPKMRLKLAEVLVAHGGTVDSFVEYERHGAQRGSDIYDAHSRLWALWVFIHRDVSDDDRLVVLAHLARELGVRWERYEQKLGLDPSAWPDRLAALRATKSEAFHDDVERLMKTVSEGRARTDTATFAELLTKYRTAASI